MSTESLLLGESCAGAILYYTRSAAGLPIGSLWAMVFITLAHSLVRSTCFVS